MTTRTKECYCGVVQDQRFGYWHLDPIPKQVEQQHFYQNKYYDLIRSGGRAPELRRLMTGGAECESERGWLRAGLYADICTILREKNCGPQVLDVGCGTGDFVEFCCEQGFQSSGLDPSSEAVAKARENGLMVHEATLEEFSRQNPGGLAFDAVVMLNVLEHVPSPPTTIEMSRRLLRPGGILCVRVPNDFTDIQKAAHNKIGGEPWWITKPDHINYFSLPSLQMLYAHFGFDVLYAQSDFPMEMFLLMGDIYVGHPEVGTACHAKRVSFDLGLPGPVRRRLYQALAEAGIGRDLLVIGRL